MDKQNLEYLTTSELITAYETKEKELRNVMDTIDGLHQMMSERGDRIRKLERVTGIYIKALEFYAKKSNYEPFRSDDLGRTDAFNFIDLDGGEQAQKALQDDGYDEIRKIMGW